MFWKKKDSELEFNELSLTAVDDHRIVFKLKNAAGKEKLLELSLDTIRKYLTPSSSTKTTSSIWHVLGIMPTTDRTVVLTAYRKMSLVYHPDGGGTAEAFQTLTNARDKALAKCQ